MSAATPKFTGTDTQDTLLPPKPLKPRRISRGVNHSMPDVAVSWIVLNQPRVRALVGQGEAARVPESVRVSGQGPLARRNCGSQAMRFCGSTRRASH